MNNFHPFSQENLNEIFKISPTDPERVISRENSVLEFKESFGWASLPKYLKTSVAYANTKGGYIVFGIANKPHRLCGLSGASLNLFENIDPETMTCHFNEHFAPEVEWFFHQYELQGKIYGIIYICESKNKPVICIKDAGKELKESDIYYRYRGRSERIKYPELKNIIEATREAEQRLWMLHFSNIARIGVREAGVFDLQTGSVIGAGGSFLIDESLLSQLSFIKEGEFCEVKGKPTLKLIGHLEPANGVAGVIKKQIIKTKGIRTADIILGALNQETVSEHSEYIKQICFESTSFLPVYYYIKKSGLSLNETIEMLETVVCRSQSRTKLIERLSTKKTHEMSFPQGNTNVAIKKRAYVEALRKSNVNIDISGKELEYCLQAIRTLTREELNIHSKFIREILRTWFNKYYTSAKGSLADNLRRAICWVDEALYMSTDEDLSNE